MTRRLESTLAGALVLAVVASPAGGQTREKPRARDLGIPFEGVAGPLNSITDVAGVEVGYATIIKGDGRLVAGQGPVRTGVTAILPRGRDSFDAVAAGYYSQNGNGEMTGTVWIEEAGELQGPVMITNTHSVGVVRDAVIAWQHRKGRQFSWLLPVVAETYDGGLNDINGFHVKPEHVFGSLDSAHGGRIAEGNVGGGTAMGCNGWKGGSGTSSRQLTPGEGGYTVGVFVQCNYGSRGTARIAGIPIAEIPHPGACVAQRLDPPVMSGSNPTPVCGQRQSQARPEGPELGSIIVVVATDAPMMPHQLKRIARRVSLGLGRLGATAGSGSGDIFVAFSTANRGFDDADGGVATVRMVTNSRISSLFNATVQATEEAVVNAMIAADTLTGANYRRSFPIPHAELQALLRKHGRLIQR